MAEVASRKLHILSYDAASGLRDDQRAARFYLVLAWIYPLLPLIALYATWLTGWVVLGHPPRPSLDDPKNIGGPVDAVYLIAGLLLMSLPVGMIVGVTLGIFLTSWYAHSRTGSWWRATCWVIALLGIYAGCILLLKWDPLQVAYWYMD